MAKKTYVTKYDKYKTHYINFSFSLAYHTMIRQHDRCTMLPKCNLVASLTLNILKTKIISPYINWVSMIAPRNPSMYRNKTRVGGIEGVVF